MGVFVLVYFYCRFLFCDIVCCIVKGKESFYWNRWVIRVDVFEVIVFFKELFLRRGVDCFYMFYGYIDGYEKCCLFCVVLS